MHYNSYTMITTVELRQKYLEFFKSKNHTIIDGAGLIPENDPSVLFTTAGMHPLVPFLLGEKHPAGTRLVNYQKCIRTGDIDEVGDSSHTTFFEMLGNWSLGEYFKKEAIEMSFEFLTEVLHLDKNKLAVTVFKGDDDAPRDDESADIWKSLGVNEERIAYLGKDDNWWGPAGQTGPCGPDSEMFYWTGKEPAPEKYDPEDENWLEIWNNVFMQYDKQKRIMLIDGMDCLYDDNFVLNIDLLELLNQYNTKKILVINKHGIKAKELLKEYGFEVFTFEGEIKKDNPEFFKKLLNEHSISSDAIMYIDHSEANIKGAIENNITKHHLYDLNLDKKGLHLQSVKEFIDNSIDYYKPLNQKNVDTGMGLERTVAVLNGFDNIYEIDSIKPIYDKVFELAGDKENIKAIRVVTDHVRAAVMIIGDDKGVGPSNLDQGYVVRRLIRSAIRRGREIQIKESFIEELARLVIEVSKDLYPELVRNEQKILSEFKVEEEKFSSVLDKGEIKIKEYIKDNKISAEEAFQLYTTFGFPIEEIQRLGVTVDMDGFNKKIKAHQDLSRQGAEQKFKGGLADNSDATTRLHTAAHLLHSALRQVLGDHVAQKGSNITAERARFDFSHPEKMTDEQKAEVETIVNNAISAKLPIICKEMTVAEAKESGALGVFNQKYGDKVKVYTIGQGDNTFSKEICGGPHVENLGELSHFRIKKEQASSAGIRRIKAVLE
jgi:alanyl-tRNA synthetase